MVNLIYWNRQTYKYTNEHGTLDIEKGQYSRLRKRIMKAKKQRRRELWREDIDSLRGAGRNARPVSNVTEWSLHLLKSWCLDVLEASSLEVLMSWSIEVLKSWSLEVLMSWSLKVLKSWRGEARKDQTWIWKTRRERFIQRLSIESLHIFDNIVCYQKSSLFKIFTTQYIWNTFNPRFIFIKMISRC